MTFENARHVTFWESMKPLPIEDASLFPVLKEQDSRVQEQPNFIMENFYKAIN